MDPDSGMITYSRSAFGSDYEYFEFRILPMLFHRIWKKKHLIISVAEPEPPLLGWRRSRLFCWPKPRASFWQAKKESLVVVTKHDVSAIYTGKCDPKKTCINNSLFISSIWKMFEYGAGATFFSLEPEPPSAGSATLLIINIINEKEKSTVTTFLFHTKLLCKVQNPQV